MKREDIAPGTRIKVKNGSAVSKFIESIENDTAYLNPFSGRAPFAACEYGNTDCCAPVNQAEGEEFEIVIAPGQKNVIFKRPGVSTQYVALRRVADGLLMETFYISVKFDSVKV